MIRAIITLCHLGTGVALLTSLLASSASASQATSKQSLATAAEPWAIYFPTGVSDVSDGIRCELPSSSPSTTPTRLPQFVCGCSKDTIPAATEQPSGKAHAAEGVDDRWLGVSTASRISSPGNVHRRGRQLLARSLPLAMDSNVRRTVRSLGQPRRAPVRPVRCALRHLRKLSRDIRRCTRPRLVARRHPTRVPDRSERNGLRRRRSERIPRIA